MILGLGIVVLMFVLQVIDQTLSSLHQSHHSSNPKHSHTVTYRGFPFTYFFSPSFPPRSPETPPLW
jgi:hypothetical protein